MAVGFLEDMDVPAYKVASFEITDIPSIEYIASQKKPVIMSTGIAYLADVEEAVDTCRKQGNDDIILPKCTSAYPTPLSDVNLRIMPDLSHKFNALVGLSDHTVGISVAVASVALGACLIEKHLIVDRALGGPDAPFSLEPKEFENIVRTIREVEEALGQIDYSLTERTKRSRDFSRSLFVTKDIQKGDTLTTENVRSIRPGYGFPPKYLKQILGKKAKRHIEKGIPLDWDLVS